MQGEKRRRLSTGAGTLVVVGALAFAAVGIVERTEAAGSMPKVLIMRCTPLGEPSFSYQVTALSHTPQLSLTIAASDEEGQGDDCAQAIAEIVAAGVDVNKLKMAAAEDALIVTVAY